MKQTLPDQALKPHWDEQLAVMNPTGALDGKTKHLIGLAVAAQIPCEYCVYGHTNWQKPSVRPMLKSRRPLQPPRSSVSTAQC
jgi:Carboxymuconolactone decarboxylase family